MNLKKSIFLIIIFSFIACQKKKESHFKFKDQEVDLLKNQEPPLIFELISGEQTQFVIENQVSKSFGIPKNSEFNIKVYPFKYFPHGNIGFEYPRTFNFEASLNEKIDMWTLSGNDFKIMFIKPGEEITVKDYINGIQEKFGAKNSSIKSISKSFNGLQLDGLELSIKLIDVKLEVIAFQIVHKNGTNSILYFQDSPQDSQLVSEESELVFKKLNESLIIN